jgi:DnaJ-class molecular chaperone
MPSDNDDMFVATYRSGQTRDGRKLRRLKISTMTPKIEEHICPACNGKGFPVVAQPLRPDRKIYPVKCKDCNGKGKITDAK